MTEGLPKIEFVDLKAQYKQLKSEIDGRIAAVLEHGRFIGGPEVGEFERALATYAGVEHAVGVANGTDALHIALMAENIGEADAVFVPSFTFTATAEVILSCGATPVFCEVDARDFNIGCDDLERRIQETLKSGTLKPKAIIAVDLFGLPADYARLEKIADQYGLFLLADSAQSFGGGYGAGRVGSLAPATAASFFPAKPLGCYGDGGALLTDDGARAEIYRSIGAHGKGSAKYDIVRLGKNSRLDTIQAGILLAKLQVFDAELDVREKTATLYDERLHDIVETPFRHNDRQSAWAQYAILLDNRDAVAERLSIAGIPTAIYYPLPMHLQSAYTEFGDGQGSLPVSETLSRRILNLPMHPYLAAGDIDRICTVIRDAIDGG